MIRRIVLSNFMAHEHSVIELGPGLTLLTGPNNTGKSAVVEALRCVAENPPPKFHIRHGAKEARVEVHLEDGWKVVWVRRKTYPLYEIWAPDADEPEVYAKTKGKVPEEIQALLRMPLVHLEESNRDIDVHLGNQRQPIFLLDQPGSAFAQFFAASTEGAHLLAMQDLLKDKSADARREVRDSEAKLVHLEEGFARLSPLPDLELESQCAEELLARIQEVETARPLLEAVVRSLREKRAQGAALREQMARLARLQAAPALTPVAGLARLAQLLAEVAAARQGARRKLEATTPLQAPDALFPSGALAALVARLRANRATAALLRRQGEELSRIAPPRTLFPAVPLSRYLQVRKNLDQELRNVAKARDALRPLNAPPELFPVAPAVSRLREQRELARRCALLRRSTSRMAELAAPPALENLEPLQGVLEKLRGLRQQRDILAKGAAERAAELDACVARLDRRLKEMGACPYCGAALETQRFLETGHRHE